jgi:glycosyltransferase involved in cell wall biosynthesis
VKKNIWILNHYATNMFKNQGGRHYWFAENLIKKGYKVTIFCASTFHNSSDIIDTGNNKYIRDSVNGIPFVFVKTPCYIGNGFQRIKNMLFFYHNLFPVANDYAKIDGKPDVIIASSVHPLTLVAGIKIAKILHIPCICEVRDLWPESLVAYGFIKRNSLLAKILYQGEKWIYKRANKLIFTMEGGKDYIIEQGWAEESGGPINLDKVYHINNGVDLVAYDRNIENNPYDDIDLDNPDIFKIVYAGSIRKANNLGLVIDAAKYVQENGGKDVKFLIFGDGDEKEKLQEKCIEEKVNNVIFKGKVEKRYIPNILSKSDLNILNYSNHKIWKYGGSQNKNFEYLASGKPILSTIFMGYDIIQKYNAGISLQSQTAESIGEAVILIAQVEKIKYEELARNARKAAGDYDFKILTDKLIRIIEEA